MRGRIVLLARPWARVACAAMLAISLLGAARDARATFYQVNSAADVPDANTATAACETATGNGICTLRAAVQQANAHAGLDTILVPAGTYALSRVGDDSNALNGDLDITDNVTIIGSSAGDTIIDGSATGDRVFEVIGAIKANLYYLTISGGAPSDRGGGVEITGGASAQIVGCIITGNSGTVGGGIANSGAGLLELTNSIVSDNANIKDGMIFGSGGGIYSEGPVRISNSTISGNASTVGGGLLIIFNGESAIINSTFSANSALDSGGALFVAQGIVNLYNTTIVGNAANTDRKNGGTGAGIYNSDATVTLNKSILSGNYYFINDSLLLVLAECTGNLGSAGGNIITTPSCTITGAYSTVAPKLGPLQDNGGPTPTHALLSGSPAVEAGGSCLDELGAPLVTDQRGVARPQGALCDLGAFELEDLLFANGFEVGG